MYRLIRTLGMGAIFAGVSSVAVAGMLDGQAYATCFPGVTNNSFLEVTNASAGLVDIRNPGNAAPLSPVNWPAPMPPTGKLTAEQVGLVFGVAIDADGLVYVANSAAFGLNIVNAQGSRILTGQAGAVWMPGQFGSGSVSPTAPQGEPAIYQFDPSSGVLSRFGTISNDGPGFGNIAFNTYSGTDFYVSDLSDGKIYHLDATGAVVNSSGFDHGSMFASPSQPDVSGTLDISDSSYNSQTYSSDQSITAWKMRAKNMLVWGVGVFKAAGDPTPRLYYGVGAGSNAAIYSVGLAGNGQIGSDIRDELVDLTGIAAPNFISDISFSENGEMLVAERGGLNGALLNYYAPHTNRVLRFVRSGGAWNLDPAPYLNSGNYGTQRNSTGGVDFAYGLDANGQMDPASCDTRFVAVGDALVYPSPKIYGLQYSPISASAPPFGDVLAESYLIDLNGQTNVADKTLNGDVEVYRGACLTQISGLCDIVVSASECHPQGGNTFTVTATNSSSYTPNALDITLPGLSAADYTVQSVIGSPSTATVTVAPHVSGSVAIEAVLSSAPNADGLSLWCKRDLQVETKSCIEGCFDISGVWSQGPNGWVYSFTAIPNTSIPGFSAATLDIGGLPAGSVVSPDPVVLSNGSFSGAISFPASTPSGLILLSFNGLGDDQCCTMEHEIEVPPSGDCEPEISVEKQCEAAEHEKFSGYLCKVEIVDKAMCKTAYDLIVQDVFDLSGGSAQIEFIEDGSPPWTFVGPDVFEALNTPLPQGFSFWMSAEGVEEGKNCVYLEEKKGAFPPIDVCTELPASP